jgi:leucyl aminopeptidase (aminopeptidase T)
MIDKKQIMKGVVNMLNVNMALKDGEKLLVVTDVPTLDEWKNQGICKVEEITRRAILAKTVTEIAAEEFHGSSVEFVAYASLGRDGVNLGREMEERMMAANVVLAITTYSLSHTDARENANKAGTRIASMPLFLPEMFYAKGPMSADYRKIKKESGKIADLITESNEARIKSRAGTDLSLSLQGRKGQMDVGILTEKGTWGNLPAGEAYCTPLEGTTEGKAVVPKGWFTDLDESMVLTFKHGEVASIEGGGMVGEKFSKLLSLGNSNEPYRSRRNVAELGIGTNPYAKRPDNVLEAEKIRGTVHVAIGDNFHMGGAVKADMHEDFVIPSPTLMLDNKLVMKNGKMSI